jgi:hypothetical protein
MRVSIVVTALILVAGSAIGWRQHTRLARLQAAHPQLLIQAAAQGIPVAAQGHRSAQRLRAPQPAADEVTAELLAFAKDLELQPDAGGEFEEAFKLRSMALVERLLLLNAAQLKDWIGRLYAETDLSDSARQRWIHFCIPLLAEDHPAAALEVVASASEWGMDLDPQMLAATLGRWAHHDPEAAVEWLRHHSDLANDAVQRQLIAGSVAVNPALAFTLIGEWHWEDPAAAHDAVIEAGKTAAQKSAILAALRTHAAILPEESLGQAWVGTVLKGMAGNLADESFDSLQPWLATELRSPQERAHFARGLSHAETGHDTGRWIEWISANLPAADVAEPIGNLIGQWTQQDYLAAGNWLTETPPSAAKLAAVAAYAQTVAEYEPLVAEQWAMTLPAGSHRQQTLLKIYQNWPDDDREAAATFAHAHGLDLSGSDHPPAE